MPFEYFCHSHSETTRIADSFFCITITRDILLNTSKMGNPQSRKFHSCTSSRKACLKFTNVLGLSNRRKSMYYQSSSRHVGVGVLFFFFFFELKSMCLLLLQVIGTFKNLLFTIYQVSAFCNNYKSTSGTGKLEDTKIQDG